MSTPLSSQQPGHEEGWLREGKRVILSELAGHTDKKLLPQPFRFQCPPLEEYTVDFAYAHQDYDTIRDGQYSRKQGRQLRRVSFQTLFVIWGSFVVFDGVWDPQRNANLLKALTESGEPFLLTIGDGLSSEIDLRFPATLRNYQVSERAGEPDDKYVNVEFTEWRAAKAVRRKLGRGGGAGGSGSKRWPVFHKLKRTDTLTHLAKQFYGKPTYARHIGKANGNLAKWGVGTPIVNHKAWKVGQKIKIPSPPQTTKKHGTGGVPPPRVSQYDALEARDDLWDELVGSADD